MSMSKGAPDPKGIIDKLLWFWLQNPLLTALAVISMVVAGLMVLPFDWKALEVLPRNPVAVDAIPDIGENQQIVFTDWMGRSPQDVDDQITYPLTVSLLGIPGVKTIRCFSMFGFSSIYIIFDESIEFYWSRSRVIEKLNSLPAGTLPEGVVPALGPDATALGQVYWYTLEGRDPDGNPVGGWDLHELRSIQDWYVRYGLLAAEGVSEVASVGGFVQEYQIDVDPDAMRAHGVMLEQVFEAIRGSNVDVGARTIEINQVEYIIRGLGFLESLDDIRETVITSRDNVPIRIADVGTVSLGPALRTGALDKSGAEAVGGVVVTRFGANPLEVIKNTKTQIAQISPGLPARPVLTQNVSGADVEAFAEAQGFAAYDGVSLHTDNWLRWLRTTPREEWPEWITISQVTIVPFYDRTGLIYETLGTLSEALILQILVTVIVVIVMLRHLRSSLLVSSVLPLGVLLTFVFMKQAGITANIVALSGIAIAIGTMVDMAIILVENILEHLEEAEEDEKPLHVVYRATSEVGSAVLTAVATTVVSFLPVFTMIGAEGKLFRPLAFTKTFALISAVLVSLVVLPVFAHLLFNTRIRRPSLRNVALVLLAIAGVAIGFYVAWWVGAIIAVIALYHLFMGYLPAWGKRGIMLAANAAAAIAVTWLVTVLWLPLGVDPGFLPNLLFVVGIIGGILLLFQFFQHAYPYLLRFFLVHKFFYLVFPVALLLLGLSAWLGFDRIFGWIPERFKQTPTYSKVYHAFPGFGKEFMPPLDEGSFLYMPTTMPHAGIGEALDVIRFQDMAISAIPEVESVVGKIGRAETPLDPAPVSMIETVVNYKSEYIVDENGYYVRFQYDAVNDRYARDANGDLIPDPDGRPFRQWRPEIKSPDDIWDEISAAAELPGTTGAPKLQPIAARIVMLQSGMRAPMGVKIKGPDLASIEQVGLQVERLLKEVPGVKAEAVIADRIVGKPYLEIDIDRRAIARYGLNIRAVQDVIEVAIGGNTITTTVEGRERYPVRVRYQRELRDSIETLGRILVPAMDGAQIPLEQLAEIRYIRGPQMIKSEDTFLTGYVLFDKQDGFAEVDVVENAQAYLQGQLARGAWSLPAGVSYAFAGSYENQIRAQKTLSVVLPAALFIIFIILFLQFRSVMTTSLIFSGIAVAWAGGFLLMWLYGQDWFLDFDFFGTNMRTLFQVHPIMLSVAIWVGFLALFGIATDDGVVIATYLDQSFQARDPDTVQEIRDAVVVAGKRRIRPCLMTTATTVLALLPVLTSTGRGADIMVPMAIPSFGGMVIELLTLFLVPVLYCMMKEWQLKARLTAHSMLEGKS
jgi:Cu(I)/Ag(I) efflux system membrane protein CusA/SilA